MSQLDDGPPTFWKVIANFYIPFTVSLHTQFVLVYYFCILFIYFTRSLNFLFNAAGNALGIFFFEFYLKFSSNEELSLASTHNLLFYPSNCDQYNTGSSLCSNNINELYILDMLWPSSWEHWTPALVFLSSRVQVRAPKLYKEKGFAPGMSGNAWIIRCSTLQGALKVLHKHGLIIRMFPSVQTPRL